MFRYEGAVTTGQPSDATDQAAYANVLAVGYGK
ncbi:MAG TPA: arabinofuranosidase catalytic domain-containing protein [Polyangia bacterium]|nr:arabinofuranosidase catalytic domain-containing protein [Polyangia bacterium]